MKKTDFILYENTPFTNFNNTVLFKNVEEREGFFNSSPPPYNAEVFDLGGTYYSDGFNFVADRSTIDLPVNWFNSRKYNYCRFYSRMDEVIYYAFVTDISYINEETTRFTLLIDGIMTFCQGQTLNSLRNLTVERQHLPLSEYEERLWEIKNNDDVIKTSTKSYFYEEEKTFTDFYVVFMSSADLSTEFGTMDNPILQSSEGTKFDGISSPVNLYVIELNLFNEFMKQMSPYPWITQNFTKISMIPKDFINHPTLTPVSVPSIKFIEIYTFKKDTKSYIQKFNNLSFSINELMILFGLDPIQDKHLLRNEYTTTELYNYQGQSLYIDNGLLNQEKGLSIEGLSVIGYDNQVSFYVENYKVNDKNVRSGGALTTRGTFLNNSITLGSFDEIPILIDSYGLAMSKSANQRELAESKLITNRVGNILDPKADLKDRFYDTASVLSNISLTGIANRFVDEYEFYRTQQAQQKDLALDTGQLTNQTTTNSLVVANNIYGLFLKFSKPTQEEMNRLRKYYKMFGYYLPSENSRLSDVRSMSIANFVQFSGDYIIKDIPPTIMEQIRLIFENGVRLWHYDGTEYPIGKDLINNIMR